MSSHFENDLNLTSHTGDLACLVNKTCVDLKNNIGLDVDDSIRVYTPEYIEKSNSTARTFAFKENVFISLALLK